MDDTDPVILCPWCGSAQLERRGDHWCCLTCQAYWLVWNLNDRRFLKSLRIACGDEV